MCFFVCVFPKEAHFTKIERKETERAKLHSKTFFLHVDSNNVLDARATVDACGVYSFFFFKSYLILL